MKETKKVISIDTGTAQKSLSDLRKEMSSLRDALLNLDEGTEEYEKVQKKLIEDQNKVSSVMNATKKSVDALPGSYNALVQELAKVKKEWKETNDEAKRSELGKKAAEINAKLKDLDASVGNYQRNVGDYKNAFTSAFASILKGAEGASSGISKIKQALNTLKSDPIYFIAAAITGLISKIKENNRAMDNIKAGTKAFQPIINAFNKALGDLGAVIGRVVNALGTALKPLMPVVTKLMNLFVGSVKMAGMVLSTMFGWIGKVANAISTKLSPVIQKVTGVLGTAKDFAIRVLDTIVNTAIKGINQITKGILTIWNFLKSGVTAVVSVIVTASEKIVNLVITGLNYISKGILSVYNVLATIASKIISLLATPAEKLVNLVISGLNIISKSLLTVYNVLVNIASKIVGVIGPPIEKLVNFVIDGINVIIRAALRVYNEISVPVSKLLGGISTGVETMVNVVIKGVNAITRGALTGINFISKPFTSLISTVIGGIESIVKVASKIPFTHLEGAVDAIDRAKYSVRNFAVDVDKATIAEVNFADKVKSVFDGSKIDVDSAGLSHVEFAERIKSSLDDATVATDKFRISQVSFADGVKESMERATVATDKWAISYVNYADKVKSSLNSSSVDVNKWAINQVDLISKLKKNWEEWSDDIASDNDKVINSISALEKRKSDLTKAFNDAEIGSDEWYSLANQIKEVDSQLEEYYKVLERGEGESAIVSEYTEALVGSYTELENKHKELLEQWKNAGSEEERSVLGKQIEGVEAAMAKMEITLGRMKDVSVGVSEEVIIVAGSYNQLKIKLKELEEQWANTDKVNNPEKFQQLAEQIQSTKDQLEEYEKALKKEGIDAEKLSEEVLTVAGSYKDLKEQRRQLQEQWENTNAEEEPAKFKQLSEAIQEVNVKLKAYEEALQGTELESDSVDKKVTALVGSYNYLAEQLREVENQWNNTNSQAKRDILEQKAASIRAEMDKMKGVMKDVGIEVVTIRGSYNELQKQLDAVREKWKNSADPEEQKRLGKIIQVLEQRVEKLNETLKPQEEETEIIAENVDYLSTSYRALSDRLSELKTQWELAGTEAERASLGKQIEEVEDSMAKMEITLGKIKDTSVGVSEEVIVVAGSYNELKIKLKELQEEWENTDKVNNPERFEELSEQIQSTKAQLAEYEEALKKEGIDAGQLSEEVLTVAGSYKALKEERKKLQEEWENINAEAEPERFKALTESIQQVDDKLKAYENTLRGTEIDSDSVDEKVASLVGSYNHLAEQLKEVETQWGSTNSQAKRDILEQKAAAIREEMDRMRGVMKEVGTEVVTVSGSYNDLQKQLDAVREKWQNSADPDEQERLGEVIQKLEERVARLNETLKPKINEELADSVDYLSTSYKYLSEQLSLLKAEWEKAGTEAERQAIAEKIQSVQAAMDKMNESLKKSESESDAVAGSYKALSQQLQQLKSDWENAADDESRKELGKQIEDIEDKMKEMGDTNSSTLANMIPGYSNLSRTLELIKNPIATAKAAVHGLSKAFKALLLNPVGAFLTAIVVAVKAVVAGFKQNDEASNKLKVAFASLKPIVDAIKGALGAVANVIGDIISIIPKLVSGVQSAGLKIATVLNKMGIVSDEKLEQMKQNIETQKALSAMSQEIAKEEIAIEDDKRKFVAKEAKAESDIADLREKASDKEKYTAKERMEYLKQAKDKEEEIAKERETIAKREWDLEKKRAEEEKKTGTYNDAAEERLMQAEANYWNVHKETAEKLRALNKGIKEDTTSTTNHIAKEEDKTLEHEKAVLQERLKLATEGTWIYINLQEEIENKDWEIEEKRLQTEKYTDEQIEVFRQAHLKRLKDLENEKNNLYSGEAETEDTGNDESILDYLQRINEKRINLEEQYTDRYFELLQQQEEYDYLEQQIKLELADATDEELELLEEEHQKKMLDIQKEKQAKYIENQKKQHEQIMDMTYSVIDAWGSIGDAMDDCLEVQKNDGKISDKEYEKRKKAIQAFQIAQIVAECASGIFDTWKGYALETATVNNETAAATGPAAAATKAALDTKSLVSAIAKTAMLGATAASQIASVKSSSTSSSSSTSTVSATASPSVSDSYSGVSYVRSIQTDEEEEQSSQPIYVKVTDIDDMQAKVKVVNRESTF